MMFRLASIATILSLGAFASQADEESRCPDGKRHYRTAIRHIESGGIGYKDGYTTFEAFFSADPSRWEVTPFLDVRGHVFDNGRWAANGGIGLRGLWGNRAYGINAYYDFRNTSRINSNQIGTGLETLGALFDFRINGYLPVGGKTSEPYHPVFGTFSGNYMLVSEKYQSAMKGADAEFGFHFGKTKAFDFYAAAGPYYFIGEVAPATWGGKGRISGSYKEFLTIEISDSYDRTFRNKFQGQLTLSYSFGPKSKIKPKNRTCEEANVLNDRMLQPVGRQEIIVIDTPRKKSVAIDPATGLPYFFVFVDNTSSSDGTYESPYHTFAQAQDNSSPNDIIYVFPGDGTTTGMDAGIALQTNQKLWGSGVSHSIATSQGTISIPSQTNSSPVITNTDMDTEGNAVTLATNNSVSGFTIDSPLNDAIHGDDAQNLDISFCTFQNTATFAVNATFDTDAAISITNNQLINNTNGLQLNTNGSATLICSNNTFQGQTSVSNVPLEIDSDSNSFTAQIENNLFDSNETGCIRFGLTNTISAEIELLNNTMTNNDAGFASSLGSNIVIITTGTVENCSIELSGNTLADNITNSLYFHTDGSITTLSATLYGNTMTNNGGSGAVFATPVNTFTLEATDNTITGCNDNAIALISSGTTSKGTITLSNNTITDVGGMANAIAVNQDFTNLSLSILNNDIDRCEGSGIVSYASGGIDSIAIDISGNTINNCQNMPINSASGISLDQYVNLTGSITNNTLLNNTDVSVSIGSSLASPSVCLTLSGNDSSNYSLTNPGDGLFNLAPCNVDAVNIGTINITGAITSVESCPDAIACP